MSKKKIKIPTKNELLKKYGSSLVLDASTLSSIDLWIPSRFLALNNLIGGGLPYGKIIEIMGEASAGKTLVAYDFAYATQQLGGKVIWVDAEQAWSNDWAMKNGLNPKDVILLNDTQIETISDAIADLSIYLRGQLIHNEPILLVVDSIAALDCSDNINSKMVDGKSEMGGRAKALYKMLRIRNELLYKLGVTSLYINQLRTSLNVGFGKDPSTTPGGAALGFYASIRLGFYGGKAVTVTHNGKERKAGRFVTVRVLKNKVAPPKMTISKAPMYFSDKYALIGFDRYFGLVDALLEENIIYKDKQAIRLVKDKSLIDGKEAHFEKEIRNEKKVRDYLLQEAGINTISTTKKRLKAFTENLFPIEEDYENYERQGEESEDEV
jgi:recombination protein RecA